MTIQNKQQFRPACLHCSCIGFWPPVLSESVHYFPFEYYQPFKSSTPSSSIHSKPSFIHSMRLLVPNIHLWFTSHLNDCSLHWIYCCFFFKLLFFCCCCRNWKSQLIKHLSSIISVWFFRLFFHTNYLAPSIPSYTNETESLLFVNIYRTILALFSFIFYFYLSKFQLCWVKIF